MTSDNAVNASQPESRNRSVQGHDCVIILVRAGFADAILHGFTDVGPVDFRQKYVPFSFRH